MQMRASPPPSIRLGASRDLPLTGVVGICGVPTAPLPSSIRRAPYTPRPFAINMAGTITGFYVDANGGHGFLRAPDGTIITFDPLGSTFTVPTAINANRVIAGSYGDASGVFHGFLRIP